MALAVAWAAMAVAVASPAVLVASVALAVPLAWAVAVMAGAVPVVAVLPILGETICVSWLLGVLSIRLLFFAGLLLKAKKPQILAPIRTTARKIPKITLPTGLLSRWLDATLSLL